MEIALIHNSSLILGPMGFNVRMINSELEDLEVEERLNPSSYQEIPIHFSDNLTHLVPLQRNIPSYNPKYERENGFTWEIVEENDIPSRVVFNYTATPRTLEEVKETRKTEVAPYRREKENTQITLNVNNTDVLISTSREERILLASKLAASPGPHKFKFKNTWVEITSQELEYILQEIDKVVQDAFDWEYDKLQEIDACETIDEVYDVVVRELPEPMLPIMQ
jgi:hypothetical protein